MTEQNPFLEVWGTPHGTVPFHRIGLEHYEPALREGMRRQKAEIDAIVSCPDAPDFANTIEAYERSGELLNRVMTVFSNQLSANTTPALQELAEKLTPLLSEHENDITLNERLFLRVREVYNRRDAGTWNAEQQKLLQDTYAAFVRHGANLTGADRETFRELTKRLSLLTLQFGDNLLKETNDYQLLLTDEAELKGLPASAVEAAKEAAAEVEKAGWLFTLHAPSYVPFMSYADSRARRKELYMAYNTRCLHGNGQDNREVIARIVNLRLQLAKLLGYDTYAQYVLERRMAATPDKVYELLDSLAEAYSPTAREEVARVEALAKEMEGGGFDLMPWDFSYYAHKLKEREFRVDNELLRPYFELEKVKAGVFGLAEKLYGIRFKRNGDIPVYHADVEAYEVFDADGSYLAVLYTDFHPRAGKHQGAWMTSYKEQWTCPESGVSSRPHVSLVMNFTKPTQEKPALLTLEEVRTFLHEFGHSLHGMFAQGTYQSLSGTNVYWDFVELPSQFMENYALESAFLHSFARHYLTGELIPDDLVQGMKRAENFNVAYACLRQVGFALIDMGWHTLTAPFGGSVEEMEQASKRAVRLLPDVSGTCMSAQFSHIFSGGYAAGYYSYKWAEVFEADAFALFRERGVFSREAARSFRENILSRGGTEHPMTLYKRFRGQEPTIDALITRNGIKR